jgi:SAM-dependent methyltransferase
MMTTEQAILKLRNDPIQRDRIETSYLGSDLPAAARAFAGSSEFAEVLRWIDGPVRGATVLDLGAGTGIASYAFGKAGAARIYAVEPDPSDIVGRGAIRQITSDLPVEIIDSFGETIPLADQSVDIIYARQVLHHTADLPAVLRECHRLLRSGGVFIACREHVVDDENQLRQFLAAHPVHQLAGGENAYRLDQYLSAITSSGLRLSRVLEPWDSVINAFPLVQTEAERRRFPGNALAKRLGPPGRWLAKLPPISWMLWRYLNRPLPGRPYSFVARKG